MANLPLWLALILLALPVAAAGQALVARALGGDSRALDALLDGLLPVIRARVFRFFGGRRTQLLGGHDADDLVQEVWLSLIENQGRLLRAWDPTRGMSLEGYAGLITQRELWLKQRATLSAKRGGGLEAVEVDDTRDAGHEPDPETQAAQRDLLMSLGRHLEAQLPERGRAVLSFLYYDECAPAEAAAAMGVNLQVVYNWQFKIRQLARAFLDAG